MKHTILILNRDSDKRVTYEGVVGYEIDRGGCLLVLKLDNGDTASFNNDEWLMFDLTPTMGWNSNACEIK